MVLREVQWRSSQRHYTRRVGVIYARRLVLCFAVAMVIGLAMVVWELSVETSPISGGRFTGFTLAFTAGLIGASFSMLTRQREIADVSNLEEIETAAGLPMIFLRLGVGVGAACILYFFFNAGLVTGFLFPELAKLGFVPVADTTPPEPLGLGAFVPNGHLAKLVVWSFAAGFSEKLVPTLLARVAKDAEPADR